MTRSFDEVLRGRRMVRAFEGTRVDPVVLERLLASFFRGPAAGNTSALDLVVLVGRETERYWGVTFSPDGRARFRWQGLFDAPVLIVVVVDPSAYPARYSEADKAATGLGEGSAWGVPYWWVDAGMAVENLLLAAVDEGLGACFFGVFEHEAEVRSALGVPEGRRLAGTVAIGHPAPDSPGRSAGRRRAPRVHWTEWSSGGGDR